MGKIREAKRTEETRRAKGTRRDMVTTNTKLISYYLCLYSSVYELLTTSQIINQVAIIS